MPADERGGRLVRWRNTLTRSVQDLPWRSATLWLIVAVNVALITLYFWSRRGAATEIHIETVGQHYTVLVDGRYAMDGDFPQHPSGGLGFTLKGNSHIASAAQPVGIDSLRVTDASTGTVLFEDDIGSSAKDDWRPLSGHWEVAHGVLTTDTGGTILVGNPEWRNFHADLTVRNIEDINLFIWRKDKNSNLQVNLAFFRNYRASVAEWRDGERLDAYSRGAYQLDRGETIRGITAMMLRPYPALLVLIAAATVLALAARSLGRIAIERGLREAGGWVLRSSSQLLIVAAIWTFLLLWYILFFVSDDMPHVPDSVLYVFQSKIFASLHLTAPAPPVRESFSIFHPHMDQVVDGRWFSHYPFGHPMFLAIGQVLHVPSLVPPALGAGSVVLIYLIGRRVYSQAVGLLAAALLMFSPFFQMTASNYMSHNTAVFVILACLAFYTWRTKRRPVAMLASGLCFGLLFNIRPLTAIAFMFPLGAFMAYEFIRPGVQRWKERLPEFAAFAAGALVMFGLYLLYNKGTTGQFFESAYAAQGTYSEDTFGFGGTHSVAFGLQNERQLLALLQVCVNGWPAFIGLGMAALPFLLGTRHRWDYVLAASFLAVAASSILYRNAAVMNGPRFWYETTPFLMLLTARGAIYLRDAAVTAGDWIGSHVSARPGTPSTAVTGTAVLCLMTGLIAFSASGWMLQLRDGWVGLSFTPTNIAGLRDFNFSDDRLLDRADEMHLHNALVLVRKDCGGWWCFGAEFWTNSPDLDSDVVWAEQQENADDIELLEHYPKRNLYLADYDERTIRPVSREEIIDMTTPTPTLETAGP